MKHLMCIFFVAFIALTSGINSLSVYADGHSDSTENNAGKLTATENISVNHPDEHSAGVSTGKVIDGVNAVEIVNNGDFVCYSIRVKITGNYNLCIKYHPLESTNNDIQYSLKINGEIPFLQAQSLSLHRYYKDSGISKDKNGNDIRTAKTEIYEWFSENVYDKNRINSKPLTVMLSEGVNIIRLDFIAAGVALGEITLLPEQSNLTYKEYAEIFKDKNEKSDEFLYIQGENAYLTSAKVLSPTYDRQSSNTLSSDNSENSPGKLKLNTIGQSSWNKPGQSIVWKFKIEKSGFYNIGMRVKQSEARGIFSTRRVIIDGKLPFDELNQTEFIYGDGWQEVRLGGTDAYAIYLKEGEHTFSMEVTSGRLGKYTEQLEDIIARLNTMYRKIIMITGTTPDPYRDYKLNSQIPDLLTEVKSFSDELLEMKKRMSGEKIQSGSDMVVLDQLILQLNSFEAKPRTIPERLSNFQDNISSLSSWAVSLTQQPLELDYIYFSGTDYKKNTKNESILKNVIFRLKMFLASFSEDYSTMFSDSDENKDSLNVWVNLSRDQTQVINDLIQNKFTPHTGIKVKLSLVQQSIVTAIAASCQPDIQLYAGDVVNLAARNAITPLNDMDGIKEIKTWFSENAFIPYTYQNNIYALPLNQSFLSMFCRTDIFTELGIAIPATWDELTDTIVVLQKNKLTAGIPVSIGIFEAMLFQKGAMFYNKDYSATAFDSEEAVNAFSIWTEFYTKYRLPQSYSPLVRFRSGEMPLLIDNYTAYNSFAAAAPEIDGLWKMYAVPGTVQKDGSINNTSISGGSGAVILHSCKNKKNAFKFIKWFASSDIQTEYGLNVENILGTGSRYDPANINALKAMNWSDDNLNALVAQLRTATFEPAIPASYFVSRSLDNAYRAVTIKGTNPREALYSYNVDINAEIQRKRQELGIDSEGNK